MSSAFRYHLNGLAIVEQSRPSVTVMLVAEKCKETKDAIRLCQPSRQSVHDYKDMDVTPRLQRINPALQKIITIICELCVMKKSTGTDLQRCRKNDMVRLVTQHISDKCSSVCLSVCQQETCQLHV